MTISIANLCCMELAELRALNKSVVALINSRVKAASFEAGLSLKVGQTVKWTGRSGIPMTGTVTKIKPKMVSVNAGRDGLWNVSATMLKAA
jgi:hypothetical protein